MDARVPLPLRAAARCVFRSCRAGRRLAGAQQQALAGSRPRAARAHHRDGDRGSACQLDGAGDRLALGVRCGRGAGGADDGAGLAARAARPAGARRQPAARARRAGQRSSLAHAGYQRNRLRRIVLRLHLCRVDAARSDARFAEHDSGRAGGVRRGNDRGQHRRSQVRRPLADAHRGGAASGQRRGAGDLSARRGALLVDLPRGVRDRLLGRARRDPPDTTDGRRRRCADAGCGAEPFGVQHRQRARALARRDGDRRGLWLDFDRLCRIGARARRAGDLVRHDARRPGSAAFVRVATRIIAPARGQAQHREAGHRG